MKKYGLPEPEFYEEISLKLYLEILLLLKIHKQVYK